MNQNLDPSAHGPNPADLDTEPVRKRPKPGERRIQILQALAEMLQEPAGERVTTAALAARLGVSEAALYRHFASKAQMYEGLIGFIEDSLFGLINQIMSSGDDGQRKAARTVALMLQFAEKNPGMARVMVGDALVLEHERLQDRMNQLFERVESNLRQCLRVAAQDRGELTPTVQAQVLASTLASFVQGRLHRFSRSGFRRSPTEQLDACLTAMLSWQ